MSTDSPVSSMKRLPEAMRIGASCARCSRTFLATRGSSSLRRDGAAQSNTSYCSSTLAPRRPSLSICPSTPTSPLTKSHDLAISSRGPRILVSPAAQVPVFRPSPRVAVLRPVLTNTQRRPTRAPRQHGAHRPTCGIPAELPNGHAEQLRARESPMCDPFVVPMSDDHVAMMTAMSMQTKKRALDPAEEDVGALVATPSASRLQPVNRPTWLPGTQRSPASHAPS